MRSLNRLYAFVGWAIVASGALFWFRNSGDANFDRVAFMHFDLVSESLGNAEGEAITPFLQNCLHDVDTLAIRDAGAKAKVPGRPNRTGVA